MRKTVIAIVWILTILVVAQNANAQKEPTASLTVEKIMKDIIDCDTVFGFFMLSENYTHKFPDFIVPFPSKSKLSV
jgi:hypothetical protein